MFRKMLLLVVTLLGIVVAPSLASAQPTTSYTANVYNEANMTAPVTTFEIALSSVVCGLAQISPAAVVPNPTKIVWKLNAADTTDCGFDFNQPGPLVALPFNPTTRYKIALVANNVSGASAPTVSANSFTKPGQAPASPAQVRVSGL